MNSTADVAHLRQGCFRLLSRGFARPGTHDREAFEQAGTVLDTLGLDAFAFAPAVWGWLDRFALANEAALESEYVRLFESGTDGALCSPMESQHLGSVRAGDAATIAARVESALRRYGVVVDDGRAPDHVGWQLELGARLCASEQACGESGDEAGVTAALHELEELTATLGRWVPRLHRSLVRHDRTGVYGSLSGAAVAFLIHEGDLVRRAVYGDGKR
ncbi:MAG: molecular chaperone TorD family protein [Actinomycetota bacterium]